VRIAWTSYVLDQGRSGIATYIQSLLRALDQVSNEHEYDIWVARGSERYLPKLGPHMHLCHSAPIVEQPIMNILWHNLQLPFEAGRHNYDLVHVPSIRRIPLVKGCPLVATIHDLAVFSMPDKYSCLRVFYHKQILRRLVHRCDRIITVSNYTKSDIVKHTGYPEERIHVIYSGLDTNVYRPLEVSASREHLRETYGISKPMIVYVSRLEHPAKNHLRLIQAFEQFKRRHDSPLVLVLAGPDWNGAEVVKDYAAQSSVRDQIHFLGSIPRDDIVRLYSTCELMAFPSLFEGFGFPLLEALACGARVICSDCTSLSELARGYAETFDPYSVDEIAASLLSASERPFNEEERQRGIDYARSFQWKEAAKQVLSVYEQCGRSASVV